MTKVFVVESQSIYESGCSIGVFSSIDLARKYIESKDFKGWSNNLQLETHLDDNGFYFVIERYYLDKVKE